MAIIASALTQTLNQGVTLESLSSSKGGTSSNFFSAGNQTPYPIYSAGHNNNGERAEVKTPRTELNNTYAFGIRYHFDSSFNTNGGYRIIYQHAYYQNSSSPPRGFFGSGNGGCGGVGSMVLASGSNISYRLGLPNPSNASGVVCETTQLFTLSQVMGKWMDVVVHFKNSRNTDGFYHVYVRLEGGQLVRVINKNNVRTTWTTMNSTPYDGRNYFKAGVYSGDPGAGTVTVKFSQVRMGNAGYLEVVPQGGATAPTPEPEPEPTPTEYRINCGGGASGSFQADEYSNSGEAHNYGTVPISGTTAPEIYYTARNSGTFVEYEFPITGTKTLHLHFCEHMQQSIGARLLHIDINGSRVQSNLDIFAEAGYRTALVKTFNNISAVNGKITVRITKGAPSPWATISAIRLT
jgi:hypothetical protein